jgi:Trichohyalin-plectin-homology domain
VKAFHTRLLLCDVLQEREAQLEIKRKQAEHERQVSEGWEENDRLKMEDYDERMNIRELELLKRKQETAKVVKQQLHEFKHTYIKRIKEELLEGELVKRKAKDELEVERLKELERKRLQARTREQLIKANEDLKVYNQGLKQKERDEEVKQAEYALKKERLDQLKKDREEQRFREKQDVREKMIQRQAEYLSLLQNREDEILNKQVAEAETKARLAFAEAEEKRRLLKEQIERSRKH